MTLWGLLRGSAGTPEAYRDVASGGTGRMMGYLALLIAIATVVVTLQVQIASVVAMKIGGPWLKQHVPEIHITKGLASSPVKQPYVFEEHGFGFVVDTTGVTRDLDPKYKQGVLLTKSELVFRKSDVETRRYSLAKSPDMVVNETTIDAMLTTIRQWLWVIVGLGVFFGLWVVKLVQIFLWSLVGLLVAHLAPRPLAYRAIWNLAIYALTVPLVFDLVKGFLGWHIPGLGLFSLAIYAGYLTWGILVQGPHDQTSDNRHQTSDQP